MGDWRSLPQQITFGGRTFDLAVQWEPALVDDKEVDRLAAAMPGTITAFGVADARNGKGRFYLFIGTP